MTPVTHAAEIGKWYTGIKSALDLSNPGVLALIGGGTGALLTGGAAAASNQRLGESPSERRNRIIKEALTGGGVGALAGAAVPTGAKLLNNMLPPATETGKRISELKNTFAPGTPTDNLLSKQAPGLLYLGGVANRAITGTAARPMEKMRQVNDFLTRGTSAEDAFQQAARTHAVDVVSKTQPPVLPGTTGASRQSAFNRAVEGLRDTYLDSEALKPTGMRGTLSEAIHNYGKLSVPEMPGVLTQPRSMLSRILPGFLGGGAPAPSHGIKTFAGLSNAPEAVQRVALEKLRNLIATRQTGELAKAFTGHKVPGGARLPGRLSYLNPGKGMGAAALLSMFAPALLRGGAGLAEQGAPYVGK